MTEQTYTIAQDEPPLRPCENAEAAALMWGRKCIALEGGSVSEFDGSRLLDIVRALRLPYRALREALADTPSRGRA